MNDPQVKPALADALAKANEALHEADMALKEAFESHEEERGDGYWDELDKIISELNAMLDDDEQLDGERDELQEEARQEELEMAAALVGDVDLLDDHD